MSIFVDGRALVVTIRGTGKLHVLWYDNNQGRPNIIGATETHNAGVTRFIISHNHYFEKHAFYWDGAGEAVSSIGSSLLRQHIGKNWTQASLVTWGATAVTTVNASGPASAAGNVNVNNAACAYIIPGLI
jgi:hypothetical protein